MRILHVIQRYWPAVGGAETYFGEISARLAAEGHQVTVAATDALDLDYFWDRRRRHISQRLDQHAGVRILRFPASPAPPGGGGLCWRAPLAVAAFQDACCSCSGAAPFGACYAMVA